MNHKITVQETGQSPIINGKRNPKVPMTILIFNYTREVLDDAGWSQLPTYSVYHPNLTNEDPLTSFSHYVVIGGDIKDTSQQNRATILPHTRACLLQKWGHNPIIQFSTTSDQWEQVVGSHWICRGDDNPFDVASFDQVAQFCTHLNNVIKRAKK